MSRRQERARRAGAERGADAVPGAERPAARGTARDSDRASAAGRPASRLGPQIALLVAVFAVAVLIAEVAGAADLGTAFGVGQIAFTLTAVYILMKR